MRPDVAAVVASMPRLDLEDVDGSRQTVRRIYEQAAAGVVPRWMDEVDTHDVELTDDRAAPPLSVRVFRPRRLDGAQPALVWLHGGAFVLGDLEANALQSGRYAAAASVVVVHVDYRLAPEHPFPGALDDCYAAMCWVAREAATLGIDAARIAVGGSSAGGCLAAAVTLMARDRGGPAIAFQMLNYPVLDDRMTTTSVRRFSDTPMWDSRNTALMWEHHLGADIAGTDAVSAYAAPARAESVAGLPPAFVLTCELDPLRDEGLAYAGRLLDAGVAVELHNVTGVCHGFDVLPTGISRRAVDWQVAALRETLHPPADPTSSS